jgi:hypothetical protein
LREVADGRTLRFDNHHHENLRLRHADIGGEVPAVLRHLIGKADQIVNESTERAV